MSGFFATQQDEDQALLDASMAPPAAAPRQAPGTAPWDSASLPLVPTPLGVADWASRWASREQQDQDLLQIPPRVGVAVSRTAIQLGRYFEDLGSAVWNLDDAPALPRQQVARDNWWENHFQSNERFFLSEIQHHTVDPAARSEAGNIVGGLMSSLGPIAVEGAVLGPLGRLTGNFATAGLASTGIGRETQLRLEQQGVPEEQALEGGIREGAGMAPAFMAPIALPGTLLTRILSGVAIGTGTGIATRANMHSYLRSIGREDLARDYDPFSVRFMLTDAIISGYFGGVHGRGGHEAPPPVTPRQESEMHDLAAAALIDQGRMREETALGVPVNHASRAWQTDALARADEQIARDEEIDVGPAPEGVGFVPLDGPRDLSPEQHLEEARQLGTDGEYGDALAHAYLAKLGGADGADEIVRMLREDASPEDQAGVMARIAELRRRTDPMEIAIDAMGERMRELGYSQAESEARMNELRAQARARGIDDSEGALYSMGAARRVGAVEDGGPLRNDRLVVPDNVRLTEMEAKVAEMAHNGASNAWIAEELETTRNSIKVMLSKSARKFERVGLAAPWGRGREGAASGVAPKTGEPTATIEEILAMHDKLHAQGFRNYQHTVPTGAIGATTLNREIARRLSMRYGEDISPATIATRLSRYRKEVAQGLREPAKYSLTESEAFSTPEQLTDIASRELGADWAALAKAGMVELVASSRDVPAGLTGLPRGVQAVHFPGRRQTYFIANNIRPENLRGLILHEIGVHHGMEAMLGKRGFREVLRQVRGMLDAEHPDIMEAREQAERYAGKPEDVDEETLAYLIETKADLPLVQSILSRLRQWLIKTFGSTFGMKLTVDDLRALALSSLRRVAEQARRESAEFTPIGRMDEALASQSGRPAPPFYSAVERVVSESKTARAPASQWLSTISKAPGVKKEELEWIGLPDFLKAQEGQVSREDLLSFVRANGVQVEETVLGGEGADPELQTRLLPLIEERERLERGLDPYVGARSDLRTPAAHEFIQTTRARIKELSAEIIPLQQKIADAQRSTQTRWSQYALPGGENYRELLLRLPEERKSLDQWRVLRLDGVSDGLFTTEQVAQTRAQAIGGTVERAQTQEVIAGFHTSHWSGHSNILAHVRFNERVDANGARTLFMEEVQSDWLQRIRERGAAIKESDMRVERDEPGWRGIAPDGESVYVNLQYAKESDARTALAQVYNDKRPPNAPFKNNAWAALALKRMIRWAAENGFDAVAWIKGQDALNIVARGLEKAVGRITFGGMRGDLHLIRTDNVEAEALIVSNGHGAHYEKGGGGVLMTPDQIREVFGKDLGGRILEMKDGDTLGDVDFTTGGEGMRAFYDKIVPNLANDIGKKFGARTGQTVISTPRRLEIRPLATLKGETIWRARDVNTDLYYGPRFDTRGGAEAWLRENPSQTETVHSLPITPELRAQALEGQPLFSMGAGKNRPNVLQDRVESDAYQNRLKAVEERLNADGVLARTALGKKSEARGDAAGGRIERVRGEGATGRAPASGQGNGEAGARALRLPREVVADILSVSGLKIEKVRGKTGADHRVSIDLPHDLDPTIADVFHAERTLIEFAITDGGLGAKGIHIKWSHAADPIRSTKAGRWLYRQFVDWALEHRYRVHSDIILSPMSVHIYESLQRQGFEVTRDSTAYLDEDGWTRTRNKQPVFRVKVGDPDASAEILLSAPAPRGGYQIDGPTLKERMAPLVEAQARRDAYDKLSPAEQAMADNPEMEFPLPRGNRPPEDPGIGARAPNPEMTAREMMALLAQEKRRAAEMRKGFEAAARCAARHGATQAARGVQYGVGIVSDAWLGQVLGLAAAVPLGITATPILAREARRMASPGSPLDRQRQEVAASRFEAAREAGQMAGEAAGLEEPSDYDAQKGVPFAEAFDPSAVEGEAPPAEEAGYQGGTRTPEGAKVPPAPAGFGEDT